MTAYRAGAARVSSTVTKQNPRPRKYASASERQAAYRSRAPEVCFRAEPKTVETLDRIARERDYSRAEVLLSMTKFALANHDWARFGLTHKPLPYEYGLHPATNPLPIWKRKRPKSLGKPVPLTPKQKAAAKAMAKAAGRKYPNLVDNIAASRLENPTVKKPTPAQLAARARFAEMARSGAFKRKAKKATKRKANPTKEDTIGKSMDLDFLAENVWDEDWPSDYLDITKALRSILVRDKRAYGWTTVSSVEDVDWFRSVKEATDKVRGTNRKPNPRKKTVSEKISQLVHEGYPQKQAVAVALSEQRAGKVKATPRKRNPAPSIAVGEYVRSYDFPGIRDDTYLEGVLIRKGAGLYTIEVSRRVVEGKEKPIPASLRVVQAAMGPFMLTGVNGVQVVPRPNPATGAKKSRTKLNPVRDFYYVVKCGQHYDGQFSSKHYTLAEVKKIAQQKADKYGCPAKITEIH